MHIGLFNTFAHGAEVTSGPDDEEHEEKGQPCVKIEGNCLKEEHESVNLRILRK